MYKEYSDWDVDETTRHEYILNGTQIVKETVCVDSVESYTLVYLYDETGAPIGIKYRTPSYAADVYDAFFFEKNLQGDIVAIYNETGVKIGTYTYDAWGNFTITVSSGVSILERLIVRVYNPFRYRGYYYDTETEWYYLQSRYYNPEWGRFINEDAYINGNGDIIGYNLFAYCGNNPINNIDPLGSWSWSTLGYIAAGVACAAVVAAFVACTSGAIIGILGASDKMIIDVVQAAFIAGMSTGCAEITYQVLSKKGDNLGISDLAGVSSETRAAAVEGAFSKIAKIPDSDWVECVSTAIDIAGIYFEEKGKHPDACWTDDDVLYNTQKRIIGEYIPKDFFTDIFDKAFNGSKKK